MKKFALVTALVLVLSLAAGFAANLGVQTYVEQRAHARKVFAQKAFAVGYEFLRREQFSQAENAFYRGLQFADDPVARLYLATTMLKLDRHTTVVQEQLKAAYRVRASPKIKHMLSSLEDAVDPALHQN